MKIPEPTIPLITMIAASKRVSLRAKTAGARAWLRSYCPPNSSLCSTPTCSNLGHGRFDKSLLLSSRRTPVRSAGCRREEFLRILAMVVHPSVRAKPDFDALGECELEARRVVGERRVKFRNHRGR